MKATMKKLRHNTGKEPDPRRYIGRLGEAIAEKFLLSKGFFVLVKNFSTPLGEIDLVAQKDGCVVFFEVKTRLSARFGPPLSAITKEKKRHIVRSCQYYINRYGLHGNSCRIDAIGINLDAMGNVRLLRHVKNAVETDY